MCSELKSNDASIVATLFFVYKKETVMFERPQEEPVGKEMTVILKVNTEVEDVNPISVEQIVKEQTKNPLCISAWEKVGGKMRFLDVILNIILVCMALLDKVLQSYVLESLQTRLL